MASKKNKKSMEITPIMGLSMMAILVMMPVIFLLSNSKKTVKQGYAAQPTPEPTATPMGY